MNFLYCPKKVNEPTWAISSPSLKKQPKKKKKNPEKSSYIF